MATITVDVVPGPDGPIYVVNGATGHTVQINDYLHPDSSSASVASPSAVTDARGKKAKRQSFTA